MKKHGRALRAIIAIFLLILAVASIFLWERYGREALTYKDVIVFNQDIQANKIVEKTMLTRLKVDKSTIIQDAIIDANEIVGKETTTFIPRGLQLAQQFFAEADLTTGSGKLILSIPRAWLYSFPQTLRRGDAIFFYPILNPENAVTVTGGGVIPLEGPLFSTKVAYVKDSTNREVVDVVPVKLDGSAVIDQIEVMISEECYNLLSAHFEEGYQFVLLYE